MGALDMRVVVDLDPLRRGIEVEGIGQALQQLHLRRAFGHPPREAFARVAGGVFDQVRLFAPLRHGNLDPAARALGQRLGHQIGVFQPVRQQDQAWRFAVVIELGQERLEDLGGLGAGAGAGVEVAVAPALIGADEEHLHAGLSALQMHGHHVRFGHAARVHALGGLHRGQRLDAVTQGGGALILHILGRLGHGCGQIGLDRGAFAFQKPHGIAHQPGIVGLADLADDRVRHHRSEVDRRSLRERGRRSGECERGDDRRGDGGAFR